MDRYYVKLQDAYVAERNVAGTWSLIGYTAPTSNNFNYAGALSDTVSLASLSNNVGWQAQNKVALNDCAASSCYWDIQLNNGTAGGQITYSSCLTASAKPLTANFEAIGAGTACTVSTAAVGSN